LHVPEYEFLDAAWRHHTGYLLRQIEVLAGVLGSGVRVLDMGCGSGAIASWFHERGCQVVGIDASTSGIEMARKHLPEVRFEQTLITPSLLEDLGEEPFDIVVSTEVVEHLYAPREWADAGFNALGSGGVLIGTTPYHGYLKNLMIAITNKFDHHINPLWDGGHIKFWSVETLSKLYEDSGFTDLTWRGAGRMPLLWKSLVIRGTRP
jgi:2-polyprenyl-3-methyl-5-hydroxy-6-metoxy-1,4-benzoquinol methylase